MEPFDFDKDKLATVAAIHATAGHQKNLNF